jgi:DNA-binding MarR family transcriptional regulator
MVALETEALKRESSEDAIVLGVLDVIERDGHVTQRHVARELGIALGLANAYLKRCVRKGLIKVSQVPPRRYAYYLTPSGFAEKSRLTADYLTHSFAFFRGARSQCAEIFATNAALGQRRVVLVGTGELAEIASLVAREHPIEIASVIAVTAGGEDLPSVIAALGQVDAFIITALDRPQDIFDIVSEHLAAERLYAPALLRLRLHKAEMPASEEA